MTCPAPNRNDDTQNVCNGNNLSVCNPSMINLNDSMGRGGSNSASNNNCSQNNQTIVTNNLYIHLDFKTFEKIRN